MCKVMNARQVGKRPAADRVYVGRPTKWGNLRLRGPKVSSLRNCHQCRATMTTSDSLEGARQSGWKASVNRAEEL
jgi:hypothetical protein